MNSISDRSSGAITLFIGVVRDNNDDRKVYGMYYEAYEEMCEDLFKNIEKAVRDKWNAKISIVHRIGKLEVNDISLVIGVSARHRNEAFDACRYAIEEIKKKAPIWKKEFTDKGEIWLDGIKVE
ncbi:MAG: molybdenum cofactor biosynthesis protein MoaE [Candidatus Nitrosothermus koennekii]|nr:MAG: molybdenum cofactor biosynthesis protein MoaE [Candidatus Nitrosothermus koennekii]